MKIAIVGSGISGLAVAHSLRGQAELTLFEAGDYFGGHTHTVDVTLPGPNGSVSHGVDTGFLVFNERTYPKLIALFAELGIATAKSDMSFSVQAPGALLGAGSLEWSGSSLNTVFSQRRNLVNRRFIQMLRDVLRFNHLATRLAESASERQLNQPLADFLTQHQFSEEFKDWYLLPMLGCIWSCPTSQMLKFPVATMIRFCHNHGLLQVRDRPQWWTVAGGARNYVEKIVSGISDKRLNTPVQSMRRESDGVWIISSAGLERFDQVVLACHSNQALKLLADATPAERATLGAIRYQPNLAVLHTDTSVLPTKRRAWAAWNYQRSANQSREQSTVCLHYLLNLLQPLPFAQSVLVSLNPLEPIAPEHVLGNYTYDHPVFDQAAMHAQKQLPALQGLQATYFCGAWCGYGFHEDGLASGMDVARRIQRTLAAGERQMA
jgi:predicted NAD/FAD-binding protein